jgi:hypothetical protein
MVIRVVRVIYDSVIFVTSAVETRIDLNGSLQGKHRFASSQEIKAQAAIIGTPSGTSGAVVVYQLCCLHSLGILLTRLVSLRLTRVIGLIRLIWLVSLRLMDIRLIRLVSLRLTTIIGLIRLIWLDVDSGY